MAKTESFSQTLYSIIERAIKYRKLLKFPHEGTERMIRGWIALELLNVQLNWNSQNIIFGETFDLLLVDDRIRPVLYLETKGLEQQINPSDIPIELEKILKRTYRRPTLQILILTNSIKWIVFDVSDHPDIVLNIEDVRTATQNDLSLLKRYMNVNRYVVMKDE